MHIVHNKRRNAALLYEFLIRHISRCIIEKQSKEKDITVALTKKYYAKGSPLYTELKLFEQLINTNVSSPVAAQKLVDEVCELSRKINPRELDAQKSKLIKEINYNLRKDLVYSQKVPNYTVYASIQGLFNDRRSKNKLPPSNRIQLEERIVGHVLSKDKVVIHEQEIKTNPKYSNAVYKFVIKRFNEKYKSLSESQKKILSKYSLFLMTENPAVLRNSVDKEVKRIKETLKTVNDSDILKDKVLMKKMNEAYKNFSSMDFSNLTEENIYKLLQYIALVEEVNS